LTPEQAIAAADDIRRRSGTLTRLDLNAEGAAAARRAAPMLGPSLGLPETTLASIGEGVRRPRDSALMDQIVRILDEADPANSRVPREFFRSGDTVPTSGSDILTRLGFDGSTPRFDLGSAGARTRTTGESLEDQIAAILGNEDED
jgi:hypothetical protein